MTSGAPGAGGPVSQLQRPAAADPLDEILAEVQKPSRYLGGEWNQIVKDHRAVDLTFALAFPDVYEIGMSHLGFRILYSLLNGRADVAAERVFCPWPDMGDALRRRTLPLTSLENRTPLARFDVVGFSLQYEMTFTNVLEMLDLGGIPLRAARRGPGDPLVVVGGPVVFNVEPLADFVDLVFVGDAEELVAEFVDRLRDLRRSGAGRAETIRELARIEGLYAPALYRTERDPHSGLLIPQAGADAPYPVRRRIVYDLDRFPFPDRIIVPHGEIVHDRVSVETMRGCPVGCRFCQAGYVYRPTRERDPNQLRDTVIRSVRATGYDQFSLSSLNTGEYGAIHPLMYDLMDRFECERVSISLSSMHASTITPELARQVRRVRKSGFTIAPEAGSQRMRDVINKNLTEEQILTACRLAFEAGWESIKLYFMLGLPTETDADVDAMADLAHAILGLGRQVRGRRQRPEVILSASSFIPKPETPFQWLGMERREELYRKQARIAARVRPGVRFKHHACETSFLEGAFSRGDRALGGVLERAWRGGARFDGWDEHFRFPVWIAAFRDEGLDPERYAHAPLDPRGPLPWQVVDSRVNRKWLALELERALAQGTLSVCGPTDCHGCAPFARECVKGTVAATTGRPLRSDLPVLSTPVAPGAGAPSGRAAAPELAVPAPAPATAALEGRQWVYRARFTKLGRLRFLGHLDLYRLLTRALRRARVGLVYSGGFNPRPKVAFGPALPVGAASEAEYLDFTTNEAHEVERLMDEINRVLPAGVRLNELVLLPVGAASLGQAIAAAAYRVSAPGLAAHLAAAGDWARGAVRVSRHGKERTFELAETLLGCAALNPDEVRLVLRAGSGESSIRPEEILRAVLPALEAGPVVVREDLLVEGPAGWTGLMAAPLAAAQAQAAAPGGCGGAPALAG